MGWWSRLWGGTGSGALARGKTAGPERVPFVGREQLGFFLSETEAEYKSLRPGDILPGGWAGVPRWSTWSVTNAIEHGFKEASWVYVCAMKNAQALAQLPWKVDARQGDGTWEEQPGHPLETLLNNPNQFWSRQAFYTRLVLELLIAGNSLVSKIRVGRTVVELWTVRPNQIAYVPSTTEYITSYVVRGSDGREYTMAAEDVVHVQLPDPGNQYWGMSPMQAASRIIDTERDAATWQKVSLQNLMIPPGMFILPGIVSPEQFKQAKAELQAEYQGALNARRPLLMGHNGREAKWQPLSMSPGEVDFIETRKLSREEICAIFGVPPPIVGLLDHATYNNIATAKEIWWEETLIPLLAFVTESFNLGLAPEFGEGLRCRPDTSKVLALLGQVERKIGSVNKLWGMGVPFNVASDFVNLGLTVEGGDVGYLPSNLMPVDSLQTTKTLEEETGALEMPPETAVLAEGEKGRGGRAALLFEAFSERLRAAAEGGGTNGKGDA